jgi:diguanylate cyclase (GGDEF)-like protein
MQDYLDFWVVYLMVKAPVIVGAAILMAAISPARRLARHLPAGSMRLKWNFLTALIGLSIIGYLMYFFVDGMPDGAISELLVPCIFFLSACFVHTVNSISLQTAQDVRRISALEYENVTDALMGIFNRRYLDRRLPKEISRARSLGHSLSILLLDLDHFKAINDTYGHQAGDRVLRCLGRLMLQSLRCSDIVARYGGEEVMIIAPDTEIASALVLADRIREVIETSLQVSVQGSAAPSYIQATASIGVTELGKGESDVGVLIERADRALYRAKDEGRNRVVASIAPAKQNTPVDATLDIRIEPPNREKQPRNWMLESIPGGRQFVHLEGLVDS